MNSAPAIEWQGGSLEELTNMLSRPALPVRIELFESDGKQPIGEVHLVAGGISEVVFGELRGDEALNEVERRRDLRFRIEPRLPDPTSGLLVPRGPEEGKLVERPMVKLMRYCEEYTLTCLLEVWRGTERASIRYHRGEMTATEVDGRDAPERLTEVLAWKDGNYRIVLPPLVLPQPSTRQVRRATTPAVGAQPAPEVPAQAASEQPSERRKTESGLPPATMPVAPAPAASPAPAAASSASAAALIPTKKKPPAEMAPVANKGAMAPAKGRPLGELPLVVHVALGLALGLAIVAAYWAVELMGKG